MELLNYMKREVRFNINNILIYIEIMIMIWLSGTVISAVQPDSLLYNIARMIFLLISCYFAIKAILYKVNYLSYVLIFICIFAIYFCINLFLYPASSFNLFYRCIIFLLLFLNFFYWNKKKINYNEVLYKIVIVIAIVSLLFYVLVNVLKINIPYTIITGDSNVPYYNYYGIYYFYGNPNKLIRLSGLFWEPGVYQIYLNMALFYYIISLRKNIKELILLLINIILTFSTTGMVLASLLLAYMFLYSSKISLRNKIIITIPILSIVLFVIFTVVGQKIEMTASGGSFYIRSLDLQLGLKIFKEHFLLGAGFLNTDIFKSLNTYNLTGPKGSSNGFITWCYTTGLLGIVFAFIPFIKHSMAIHKKKEKIENIMFIILIFVFNNSEPIYQLPLMIYILAAEYYMAIIGKGEVY